MTQLLQTQTQTPSLYEQDILLWVEDTVAKLKAGDFQNLDLENLIEEVESVGRSDRKELLNRLIVLFEHLLKRLYVKSPDDYNGWERTIRTQRNCLGVLIEGAPSLQIQWQQKCDRAWMVALKTVRKEYKNVTFPHQWPYSLELESLLDRDFWD